MDVIYDDDYGFLRIEWVEGKPFIHLEARKWSHNIMKNIYLPRWVHLLDVLQKAGHEAVFTVVEDTNKKALKFHMMFGMEHLYSEQGYTVMWRGL